MNVYFRAPIETMLATEKSSLRERYRYHNLFIDKKYKYISYIKESQTYIRTYLKKI